MDEKICVAFVGRFQMGKSSCINGLLRSQMASVGNGWRSQTAECSEYPFADGVVLVDTPGFDDNPERDEMTEKAIRRADVSVPPCEIKAVAMNITFVTESHPFNDDKQSVDVAEQSALDEANRSLATLRLTSAAYKVSVRVPSCKAS